MTCICAIAVYAGGELADITLYREWEMKDLFVEASALMALFSACRNKREYMEKRYTFEERITRNTGDEKVVAQWCLETADFILAADLDRMSLYPLSSAFRPGTVNLLHEPSEPYTVLQLFALFQKSALLDAGEMKEFCRRACLIRDHHYLENLDTVLRCCRVSFEKAVCEAVVNLILDDERLMERLSGKLRACYIRAGRINEVCRDQWYDA